MRVSWLSGSVGAAVVLCSAAHAQDIVQGPHQAPAVEAEPAAEAATDRSEAPLRPAPGGSGTQMLQTWDVGEGFKLGLGRFGVGEIAQRANHTERMRAPMEMHGRSRRIAGMGLHLKF